jgi:hypothetical protein
MSANHSRESNSSEASSCSNHDAPNKWVKVRQVFTQLTTSAVAGASARLTSVVILHPFDVIKTRYVLFFASLLRLLILRLQYQRSISNDIISYRNWYQVVPQMIRNEGFLYVTTLLFLSHSHRLVPSTGA